MDDIHVFCSVVAHNTMLPRRHLVPNPDGTLYAPPQQAGRPSSVYTSSRRLLYCFLCCCCSSVSNQANDQPAQDRHHITVNYSPMSPRRCCSCCFLWPHSSILVVAVIIIAGVAWFRRQMTTTTRTAGTVHSCTSTRSSYSPPARTTAAGCFLRPAAEEWPMASQLNITRR
jgi:hypothetical protein